MWELLEEWIELVGLEDTVLLLDGRPPFAKWSKAVLAARLGTYNTRNGGEVCVDGTDTTVKSVEKCWRSRMAAVWSRLVQSPPRLFIPI